MANPKVEAPANPVMMVSGRDYRLSSLFGFVINFKAGIPHRVLPMCYAEAVAAGCYEAEDQSALDPVPEVDSEKKKQEDAAEAAKLAAENKTKALNEALIAILTRNNPDDFKNDGTPKIQKVVAEMSPEIERPTSTEIVAAYEVLQENFDLAED